jgi:monoamine oxidase
MQSVSKLAFTRRTMLAGMGALAARPSWAGAPVNLLPGNPDVVIIGAGAAGIGAARAFQSYGLTCIIVEAADRIGGRALTDTTTFGVPFDIGCAWIHAADRNPFFPLAQQANYRLQYHDLALDGLFYEREAGPVEPEHKAEETIHERVAKIAKKRDVPVSAAMKKPITPPFGAAATYMGPMDMAVDFNRLSTADFAQSADLDPNFLVYEGFGSLVAKTGEGLPVKLSTPALKVGYGGKGVQVETPSGTIDARAAIVTVSTGVLASGAIRFDPALPVKKAQAIHDVPMGLLAKIPLLIPGDRLGVKPFENVQVEYPGLDDIYFLAWPFETDLFVGFVGGKFGWELSKAGDAAAIDFAKQRLGQTFGSDAPGKVQKALFTHWANNPLTMGAYSAAAPGHFAAREEIGKPLVERVFFAGEALAGPMIQTCGGAFSSGETAAFEVARVLMK